MEKDSNNKVIAYIYNKNDNRSPGICLSKNLNQMASFIVKNREVSKIEIVDANNRTDKLTLEIIRGFIDKYSEEFKDLIEPENALFNILLLMQSGKIAPEKVKIFNRDINKKFIEDMYSNFGISLTTGEYVFECS